MASDERDGAQREVARETAEERLARVTVGKRVPLNGTIHLAPYDPAWPAAFARMAARVRAALGGEARLLEHVGSTSVPGLPAKPIIDAILAVADSADEPRYVDALVAQGFELRIREPDWFEHRLLKHADPETNLHVFTVGCEEIARMLAFRDHLRSNAEDLRRYQEAKTELAARTWKHTQDYADAKTEVVRSILERAENAPRGALRAEPKGEGAP